MTAVNKIVFQSNSYVKGADINGKKITNSNGPVGTFIIDTEIEKGIVKATFDGNVIGGKSHYPLYGVVHRSKLFTVQNTNLHDRGGTCTLNNDSIYTGLKYVYNVSGRPEFYFYPQTGSHTVAIEVNMNKHTIHFFVDGEQIPHCVVNVPSNLYLGFTLYHASVEVRSLTTLNTPTVNSAIACGQYPWMDTDSCPITFLAPHTASKAVITGSKIISSEDVIRNFAINQKIKWGIFKITFIGTILEGPSQFPVYGLIHEAEVIKVHTANIYTLKETCVLTHDSIRTGPKIPFSVSGKTDLFFYPATGAHTVAIEIDMLHNTAHFFVNDKQIPHSIVNVPPSVYAMFTLLHASVEVKSFCCLSVPTINASLVCAKYLWNK